jgi:hypothetical protein
LEGIHVLKVIEGRELGLKLAKNIGDKECVVVITVRLVARQVGMQALLGLHSVIIDGMESPTASIGTDVDVDRG